MVQHTFTGQKLLSVLDVVVGSLLANKDAPLLELLKAVFSSFSVD